jgi:imidazolonepropionase-like amidohydrolase
MNSKPVIKIVKFFIIIITCTVSLIALSIPISRMERSNEEIFLVDSVAIALTHVNILTFENLDDTINNVLYNQTIIIDNGNIQSIGPTEGQLPQHIKIIDAKGKYLMPGLVDMHTHLFDRSDLTLYLANGVTTVRNMMGFPMHLKWRKEVASGKLIGATVFTASPTINSGDNAGPFHKKVKNEKQIKKAVEKYAKAGYDFIKIYDGLDSIMLDEVLAEAKKHNMPVAGHPPYKVDFDELLSKDIVSLEHVEEILQGELNYSYNEASMRIIAQKIKEAGIYVTPTLSAYRHILLASEQKELFLRRDSVEFINPVIQFIGRKQLGDYIEMEDNSNVKLKFEIMKLIVKILHEEGVNLLLGTDTGPNLTLPGFTLHDEIILNISSGVDAYSILYSGTMNAAKALGIDDQSGSVSVGKNADLILLNENPLEKISTLRNPVAVFQKGTYYNKEALSQMKENGKDHSSTFGTIGRLLDSILSK